MTSKFWTVILLVCMFVGSCLALAGCGRSYKEIYDEPIGPSSITTWDNGSVTYWEDLETEEIITENIITENIITEEIIVNEITTNEITIE